MKAKILTILFTLFSCIVQISAQTAGGIKGVVKDATTKEILSGVTILVEQTKTGTSTDKDGYYELNLARQNPTGLAWWISVC